MKIIITIAAIIVIIVIVVVVIKQRNSVPDWARFFSKSEYENFISLIEKYFEKRGQRVIIEGAAVRIEGDEGKVHGLNNLAELCNMHDRGNWEKIISEHFDNFRKIEQFAIEFDKKVGDFDQVSQFLCMTVYPPGYMEQIGEENLVSRVDLPGTNTVLVFDLPYSVNAVNREQSGKWNKKDNELFETGLKNLTAKGLPKPEEIDIGGGIKIWIFEGEDFFVAANVLLTDKRPEYVGKYGSLVGIPTRHLLLYYPINDMDVIKAVNAMILIIHQSFAAGPGSTSEKLYWYRRGKFIEVPYSIKGKKVSILPPDEFVEMLNGLAGK